MALASPTTVNLRALRFEGTLHAVVDDLQLHLEPGKICVLFGPNGCGKSTALRYLTGNASDLVSAPNSDAGHSDLRTIYIPQRTSLAAFQWLSPIDNVAVPFTLSGAALDVARTAAWRVAQPVLARLPRDAVVGRLSGGQQSAVVLARAGAALSARDIGVLLNDEGYASLDYHTKFEVAAWLRDRCRAARTASVTVAHDAELAAFLADEILILSRRPARITNRILVEGPNQRSTSDLGSKWLADTIQAVQTDFERALDGR